MTNHFGHTKVVVADLDRSAAFYADVLGLAEQMRVRDSLQGRPVKELVFAPTAPGGASLVLLQFADEPTVGTGETVLVFRTDDVDAVFARGLAAGGSVAEPIRDAPAYGIRVGFLADLDGHLVEVIEHVSPA